MRRIMKALSLLLAVVLCLSAFFVAPRGPFAAANEIGEEEPGEPGQEPGEPEEPEHVHEWGDWYENDDDTHTRTCAVCGATETGDCEFVEPLFDMEGHHVSGCKTCGAVKTEDCTFGEAKSDGKGFHTAVCEVCGGETKAACEYEDTVTPPTETAEGFTTHVCKVCGYTFTDSATPAEKDRDESPMLGDLDGDGKFTAGEARQILRAALSLDTLEPGQYALADIDMDGKITASDARLSLRFSVGLESVAIRHDYTYEVKKGASCTATGELRLLCAYCGDDRQVVIPSAAHTFGEPVVTAATCTEKGESVWTCTACGLQKRDILLPKGHDYAAPTADHGKQCKACGRTEPGWTEYNGEWYYYNEDGTRLTGKHTIDGEIFYFDEDGVSSTGRRGGEPKVAVLGDSLVVSLQSYVTGSGYDFYGKVSLHVNTMDSKSVSGSDRVILDEVIGRDYDRVVVLVGINDLDYANSAWGEAYRTVLRTLKANAPGARIYAHGIFPVNEARSRANGYVTTMAKVLAKNEVIERIAAEEDCYYLDPIPRFTNEDGELPYDAATDGIHFGPTYANIWYEWVKEKLY